MFTFFLWLLCASTYFENLEFLTFNSTVNEQLILQLSLVILSTYPIQLLLLVVCKSDWLLYKKRCASVCAWKDNLLVKCREGVKRYTSIALIQDRRPLGWKPILVMSAFCGTKLFV